MESSPADRVTQLLAAAGAGKARAADELLPLVYDELRVLAGRQLAAEPRGQTLQPTALVHEAYLRLVRGEPAAWENRGHFYSAAARAMRRILIERARKRAAARHGGGRRRVTLSEVASEEATDPLDLLALDEALSRLERRDPRMSEIVMLRYFAGLGVEDTAAALGVSVRTVKRDWAVARAWLFEEMSGGEEGSDGR